MFTSAKFHQHSITFGIANKFGILVPCVTFDQPLWLQVIGIIAKSGVKIVARLGGFHTTMSFLENIGKLMAG